MLDGGPLQSSALLKSKTQQSLLIPIEEVPLGATVDAQNPDGTGFDAVRGVASDWQRIELVMHRSDGAILEAELLRHRSEIEYLEVGQWYELATDEEDFSGWTQVVAIKDDVFLGDGEGNLVVSRFKTIARKDVVRIQLENGDEIIGTAGHRTWCVNRQKFIGLGEFEQGDLASTDNGNVAIVSVETGLGTESVFNLEIAGQHVYRVGATGVLVHNMCHHADDVAPKSVVPSKATDTLNTVRQTGQAPTGYKGGRTFKNDGRGGGQALPKADGAGNPITYKEFDVNPYTKGVNRGAERVVVGSDGKAYFTGDHYATFTPID